MWTTYLDKLRKSNADGIRTGVRGLLLYLFVQLDLTSILSR